MRPSASGSSSNSRKAKPSSSASSRSGNASNATESNTKRVWSVGEPVLVKAKQSSSHAPSSYSHSGDGRPQPIRRGKVERLRSSGTVDIYYENGEVEERVGKDRIEADTAKGSSAKKTPPLPSSAAMLTSRGTSSQAKDSKAAPKNSSSRSTPTTTARSSKSMGEQQAASYARSAADRPATTNRPSNMSISTQQDAIDQRANASKAPQQRMQTSGSGDLFRKSRSDEDEQTILFSPVASDAAGAMPPRRAKTADVSNTTAERMAVNSSSRSSTKSATATRKPSAVKYSDMGEALAENQKQVTNILDRINDNADDATVVVSVPMLYAV